MLNVEYRHFLKNQDLKAVRRPLVWISVALISGAAFASFVGPPFSILLIVFLSAWGSTLLFIVFKRRAPAAVSVLLAGFSLGACTYLLNAYVLETPDSLAQNFAADAPMRARLTGSVIDCFASPDNSRLSFILDVGHIEPADNAASRGAGTSGLTRVNWYQPAAQVEPGDIVQVTGSLKLLKGFKNPGAFDYERYMHRRRIFTTVYARGPESVVVMGAASLGPSNQIRNYFRSAGLRIFSHALLTRETKAFVSAVVLGERSLLTKEMEDWFRQTGTFHILAISGLHVGLVYLLVSLVLVPLPIGARTRIALSILLVWLYALATGGSVSVTRASIMLTLVLMGYYIDREGDFLTSIAVAALLIVGLNPVVVDELSFQLSFTAVVLLCTFEPVFSERLYPFIAEKLHGIPSSILHRLSITMFASLVIGIGMLPVVAYHFNTLSLVFPFANLIVVPLLSLVLASAFACLLVGMVWLKAALVFGLVTEAFSWIIFTTVKLCSLIPGSSMRIASPPLSLIGLEALAVLLFWWQARPSRKAVVFAVAAALTVATHFALNIFDAARLRATFLDVGDSDSCLVEFPKGETMLVDTGFGTRYLDCGEQLIAPFLWKKGMSKMDTLVLTHPDSDHTGGARFLIENFSIGRILLPDVAETTGFAHIVAAAEEKGYPVRKTASGDVLAGVDGVRIEVLNPPSGYAHDDISDNDKSIVLRITYGETTVLLTGDAEGKAHRSMEGSRADLRSTVLKAPHHGLKSGFSKTFLEAVHPELIVISGRVHRANQRMGERTTRYAPFTKTLLSTSDSGAIIVETEGKEIEITTTRKARRNLF